MTQELSPLDNYIQLDCDMRDYQLGIAGEQGLERQLQENYSVAYKQNIQEELKQGKVDPDLKVQVGTVDFFTRALDITWSAHRDRLSVWERGNGEGRTLLLRNIMEGAEERNLPSLEELMKYADEISLPTHMVDTLLIAGAYDQAEGMNGFIRTAHSSLERRDNERLERASRGIKRNSPGLRTKSRIALVCLKDKITGYFKR